MRFLIVVFLSTMLAHNGHSQNELGQRHEQHVSNGMYSLLAWSIGNIALGAYGSQTSSGELKYFHQFNAGWNVVNLGLASSGLLSLRKKEYVSLENEPLFEEVNKMSKVFLFNAGLDIGYMAFGAFLIERGTLREDLRLSGFGKSLLLQGGFLFAFDLLMYTLLNTNSKAIYNSMSTLAPSSTGLGFLIRF